MTPRKVKTSAPSIAPVCSCVSAAGEPKKPYFTRKQALDACLGLVHFAGYARIYACPETPVYHTTTTPSKFRKDAS